MRARWLLLAVLLLLTSSAAAAVVQVKSIVPGAVGTSASGATFHTLVLGDLAVGSSTAGSTLAWHGYLTPSMVAVTAVPAGPATALDFLNRPSPNPARSGIVIRFGVSDPRAKPRLDVYDVTGRRVAALIPHATQPGTFSAAWNLRDARGVGVGAGIYFLRLSTPSVERSERIVVMH